MSRYLDKFLRLKCAGDVLNVVGWNPKRLAPALAVRHQVKQIVMERKRRGLSCTVYAYDDPLLAVLCAFTFKTPVILVDAGGELGYNLSAVNGLTVVSSNCTEGDLNSAGGIVAASTLKATAGAIVFAVKFPFVDGAVVRSRAGFPAGFVTGILSSFNKGPHAVKGINGLCVVIADAQRGKT